jgi:pimeloyl-ACP methyl ester carboxylesterase
MHFLKGPVPRYIIVFFSLAIWLAIGRYFLRLDSVIDLVHFSSVPLLGTYLLIFRPKISTQNLISYSGLFLFCIVLVSAYLITFAKAIPHIRINWLELPIAVYFLLSVYAVLWLLDKFINMVVSAALRTNRKNSITKNYIKTAVRFAVMLFVFVPYLVALFSTHWIKFSDAASPKKSLDMEYRQVSFFAKDGAKLDGWFIPSATRVSDSCVLIVPGRSPAKNVFLSYARIFSGSGYNVFLFDLRGNGGSSGHKYSFGLDEANDVLGAVDYLRNNCSELSEYIFGFGINEGASALIAAAAADDRFAGVVIDNPSGYEIALPEWVSYCMPAWLKNTLLKTTRSVVSFDIGQTAWGKEGLYEKISQISPCPILVTNSFDNDEPSRTQAVALYAKAKDPKMLWLTPPQIKDEQDISVGTEYFQNILDLFILGKTKQQAGPWRISRIN